MAFGFGCPSPTACFGLSLVDLWFLTTCPDLPNHSHRRSGFVQIVFLSFLSIKDSFYSYKIGGDGIPFIYLFLVWHNKGSAKKQHKPFTFLRFGMGDGTLLH